MQRRLISLTSKTFLLPFLTIFLLPLFPSADPIAPDLPLMDPLTKSVEAYYEGRIEESIQLLEENLTEGNPAVARELFRLYHETGPLFPLNAHTSYSEKIETLSRHLLSLIPDDPTLARELFIAAVLAGNFDAARALLPLEAPSAESLFYEGLMALETGSPNQAISLFRDSLALDPSKPIPWYFLGKAYVSIGDIAQAENSFRESRRRDPSFLPAFTSLAETVLAQGKVQEGYALLSRLKNILPFRLDIRERIVQLETRHPELVARAVEATKARLILKDPPRVTPFPGDTAQIPLIRVALAQHLFHISFKITDPYRAVWKDPQGEEQSVILPAGIYRLHARGRIVTPYPQITDLPFPDSTEVSLYPTENHSTVLFFNLLTERGSFIATVNDRSFRGSFKALNENEGFSLINVVNLEEYLYSVLPSEMPASWPMEALKAQAVAARSYSLARIEKRRNHTFDVFGSSRSASYRGVESEHTRTTLAVEKTQGMYLQITDRPLEAFYSANSGGHGEGTKAVWGFSDYLPPVPDRKTAYRHSPIPLAQLSDWLQSVPLTYGSMPGFHFPQAFRWERWVTPEEILSRLGRDAPAGRVTAVVSRGRGISGRVRELEVYTEGGSVRLRGDRVRIVLGGLRSTLFTLRVKVGQDGFPEYFIFNGGGWGHGVGMDQSGAAGMASVGYTFTEILQHYYPESIIDTYLTPTEESILP